MGEWYLWFLGAIQWVFILFLCISFLVEIQQSFWCIEHTIKTIPTTHKVVALTIDDGPHYKTTPEILAVLKEKHVRATFFVLGENVERSQELLNQEVTDGHEIGNHAYSHKPLTKMTKNQIKEELTKTENLITKVASKPVLFRPPGGTYNKVVLQTAQDTGYTTVLWSIDPHDWDHPSVKQVVAQVINNVKPGSIVLLHDGQYPLPTSKAISVIIDTLKNQGYEFVTVSELLQYYEIRPTYTAHNTWDLIQEFIDR